MNYVCTLNIQLPKCPEFLILFTTLSLIIVRDNDSTIMNQKQRVTQSISKHTKYNLHFIKLYVLGKEKIPYNRTSKLINFRLAISKNNTFKNMVFFCFFQGVVNTVSRQKPGALSLVNKALKSIYSNPASIFITETADKILFDGILINCGVKDFAGKAICSQLREASQLRHVTDDELAFSLLGSVSFLLTVSE